MRVSTRRLSISRSDSRRALVYVCVTALIENTNTKLFIGLNIVSYGGNHGRFIVETNHVTIDVLMTVSSKIDFSSCDG
jgi:hypothetical protein